jgi:hypothetical protein
MKTKFLNWLFAIVLILLFGCSKEPDNEIVYTDGYIVDYNSCAAFKERGETTAKARGYYIISENLKDTLLTFNLPDDLFEFPWAFFGYAGTDYDWKEGGSTLAYRYEYKIRFTYRLAEEEEKIILLCNAFLYDPYLRAKQVIIKTASKL